MRDLITVSILLISFFSEINVKACTSDVTILEGTSLQMCSDNIISINASPGFTSYTWSGAGTGTASSITPTVTGTYIVTADDGTGCLSSASIDIIISTPPTPTIQSSGGNVLCPDDVSTTLSTTQTYFSYLWSTSETNSAIFASTTGTYSVEVTDGNGCTASTSYDITKVEFDLDIGSSSICQGNTSTITATGATNYVWSTGELGSSIVVAPNETSSYYVKMTNDICLEIIDFVIEVIEVPYYNEIKDTVYTAVAQSVYLSGPEGFDLYSWVPTDYISNPTREGVTFTGDSSILYTVTASTNSGCSVSETVQVIVVSITAPEGFSPNNDGINDFYVIPELYDYPAEIDIWNRWGDIVYSSDHYTNDWDGTCEGPLCIGNSNLPEGTYFYRVKVEDVKFDGFITLKR